MEVQFKSRVYQPERLSISSHDATSTLVPDNNIPGYYSQFKVILRTPLLNAQSLQLLRATIPNIATNIPNDEATFWYYRLPNIGGVPAPKSAIYLHMIRLIPSWIPKELLPAPQSQWAVNRFFQNYEDLVTELNKATLNDTTDGIPATFFIPGDINFGVEDNKLYFQGNNAYDLSGNIQYFYVPAGWNENLDLAKQLLQDQTSAFDLLGFPGQPYTKNRTLDLRLGFTTSGSYANNQEYYYQLRPSPNPVFQTTKHVAETFGDLVFSGVCNIYTNIASTSGYDTNGNPNLLCSVSMDSPTLGVTFYNNLLDNPLTKIINDIYEVTLSFTTDTGKPFLFPINAIINLEIGFSYL